jgi:manganese transport protein
MNETPVDGTPPSVGWRREKSGESLPDVHRSVLVPQELNFWKKLLAFSGPGYLVAVGYMDPGNWATALAGGSRFGYTLLSVVLLSNFMAIVLQTLCARLGIATGRDLAQACRDHYSRPTTFILWIICEVAICACDLAEVVGSAIALELLFHIPLVYGVLITGFDVLLIMFLAQRGFRYLEALVVTLIVLIGGCFLAEVVFAKPDLGQVMAGFVPRASILTNPAMLYVAIGILGATVMPHNLYLHSSIVQTRKYDQSRRGRWEAIRFATIDSTVALMSALFINAAILVVAAAAFHKTGRAVEELQDAYQLLSPMLGASMAGVLFALALLASGQNSTLTGTLAGQVVMEGFLNIRLRPWLRRLITRSLAVIPAVLVAGFAGEKGANKLIILSQVILSLQLPFAIVPLVQFTSSRSKMGEYVNPRWLSALAWLIAFVIIVLNIKLLFDTFGSS